MYHLHLELILTYSVYCFLNILWLSVLIEILYFLNADSRVIFVGLLIWCFVLNSAINWSFFSLLFSDFAQCDNFLKFYVFGLLVFVFIYFNIVCVSYILYFELFITALLTDLIFLTIEHIIINGSNFSII